MSNFLIGLVIGLLAGGLGAVIYYRRNIALIEAGLKDAQSARDDIAKRLSDLTNKKG